MTNMHSILVDIIFIFIYYVFLAFSFENAIYIERSLMPDVTLRIKYVISKHQFERKKLRVERLLKVRIYNMLKYSMNLHPT